MPKDERKQGIEILTDKDLDLMIGGRRGGDTDDVDVPDILIWDIAGGD